MRRRQIRKRLENSFDVLEARVVLGYLADGLIDEAHLPGPPTSCPCPTTVQPQSQGNPTQGSPSPVRNHQYGGGQTASAQTEQPVRGFDGTPVIFTADLGASSSPVGMPWGITRSWSGRNNTSDFGNGWNVAQLPYLSVSGGIDGSPYIGGGPAEEGFGVMWGTAEDERIQVVEGGTTTFTFSIQVTQNGVTFVPWGSEPISLELTSDPTPALRLTDSHGNITDFYDVARDVNGKPVPTSRAVDRDQLYGRFKSHQTTHGTTSVTASYDIDGFLTSETLSNSSTGATERLSFTYTTVTNDLVTAVSGDPATMISSVVLERPDGMGWRPVQRALYTYYTGRVSDGLGGWLNDTDGRLGDLKFVQTQNAHGTILSPTWQTINTDYYRYYKFTGESNGQTSYGPTNVATTTGGPNPVQPVGGTYNPSVYDYRDSLVLSGLKTVVTGASLELLAAAIPSYQTSSDSTIQPYINHFFKYERWGDHVGVDGNPGNGAESWSGNGGYGWRIGYRIGTQYRVVEEIAQGAGCSCSASGEGVYKYEYAANNLGNVEYDVDTGIGFNSIEYNTWRMRLTEYLPSNDANWGDHDRKIVYTNEVGQPILEHFVDVAGPGLIIDGLDVEEFEGGVVVTIGMFGHPFVTGDRVVVTGLLPTYLNGVYTITQVPDEQGWNHQFSFFVPVTLIGRDGWDSLAWGTPQWVSRDVTITPVAGEWLTYYRYDNQGRISLVAHPSAVTGYNDAYLDLVHDVSGNSEFLDDTHGLIETYTYYTSTTATSMSAGGAAGYLYAVYVKQGESGTPIVQETTTYIAHTAGSQTVFLAAAHTVYGLAQGSLPDYSDRDPHTTTYTYTWFSGTNEVESITTSLPIVTSGQNGPGTADTTTVVNDLYGRPVWLKDADGFITYVAYDALTGAVVKTITDVDTTQTSDFIALPSGWTTPGGGGLHLITRTEVDGLGRPVKETDANGNVTYIVYNDEDHEVRIYRGWDSVLLRPTGPTLVIREDRARGYIETLEMTVLPASSMGVPTGDDPISGVVSLTRDLLDYSGRVIERNEYFNLSGVTYSASTLRLGTLGTNYYAATFGYDDRGRENRVTSHEGTITKQVYDALSRPIETWVGTSTGNLVKTTEYEYDQGGIGNSNLTKSTSFPGGGADARVSESFYDWRDRLVVTKDGVQISEGASVNRPITYSTLNNLGQATSIEVFDGDGISITDANSDGVPDKPSASLLRAKSTLEYDRQGRVFASHEFSVNQSNGTVSSDSLTTAFWFDHRGNVLKQVKPGGSVLKSAYDGAGRVSKAYLTDGGGDSTWADAGSVTGDTVLEQVEYQYDANSNLLLTTTRQRFHDESNTGALGTASSGTLARVSYVANFYDALDRPTASVNLGTYNGASYSWTSTIPGRSDTALVTSYGYDSAGHLESVIDPRAIESKQYHDAMGRVSKTIEAYTNGTPTDTTDKTVEYTYNSVGQILTLKVILPGSGEQTTQYLYGVDTTGGSALHSNNLLGEVRHPDKSTGAASASEDEHYTYNALGQILTATDRNGTTHTYTYDVLGRRISDAITTPGVGIDQSVLRLETTYDIGGRPVLLTSYDAASGGNVVNQVQRVYNGLGQLITEYQAHGGTVNTSTSPKVQYAYGEMSGSTNQSRLVSMTYPNGRVVHYGYASGVDSSISRLSFLADDNGSGGIGTHLEEYQYLGLGTVVSRARPEPGIDLSYVKRFGELNGDAGDQYTGLDRFGRVVDQRWLDPSSGTATDRFQYGYDRNGNRLYRENLLDSAMDELYHVSGAGNGYDALNQLTGFARGALSDANSDGVLDTVASPSRSQGWDFDALGNWESLSTDGTPESRSHNRQNQVTTVGASTLTYDANGNMTTDETGRKLVYDGWNRLVAVKDALNNPMVEYSYDALRRRITEDNGTVRDLYYSAQWQVLEERVSGNAVTQYVWSPMYVDALVLRDHDADGVGGTLEERLYVQQDANWNVTALTDETGAVVERYIYDPYGQATVLAANWTLLGSSAHDWVYLHQGGRYDSTSELYHFRNRDLSPKLGRWTSTDPISFRGNDANLYRYTNNTPINFLDSTGEFGFAGMAIGGAIGGLIGGLAGGVGGYIGSGGTWEGARSGAISGGIGGMVSGGLVGSGAVLFTPGVAGVIGGTVGSIGGQLLGGQNPLKPENVASTMICAATGGGAGHYGSKFIQGQLGNAGIGLIDGTLSNGLGTCVNNFTSAVEDVVDGGNKRMDELNELAKPTNDLKPK